MNRNPIPWLALLLSFGLTACAATPTSAQFSGIRVETVAEGLTAPTYLVSPPGDTRRFVLDQVGTIHILDERNHLLRQPFLDVRNRMVSLRPGYDERGLLGLAFHPDYADNGRFFVYYSAPRRSGAPAGWDHTSHLSEFRVSRDNPDRADPRSERILLQVDQPQANHNGGRLVFGPDGYLYVALGDGGAAGDEGPGHPPLGNGQDVTTLLGSILRLDVEKQPYGIPSDNPLVGRRLPGNANFAGDRPREEIWAWGLRNPWGFSFDRETGKAFAADVGQNLWEEINLARPGNFGWRIKEGAHWYDPENRTRVVDQGPDVGPLGERLIDPILEYRNLGGHDEGLGISAIGGYVYRGKRIPALNGRYVFGDWSESFARGAGKILIATPPEDGDDTEPWTFEVARRLPHYVLGFGEDAQGELYVLVTDQSGPRGNTGRVLSILAP